MAPESSLQPRSIVPGLTVNDLEQSIAFYEGLGFVVDERWEDNGVLMGVMIIAGGHRIGLSQDDWQKGRDRVKGQGMRLYVETSQHVDELATRARAAGIPLDRDPHDTPWKTRAFDVTDPSGFKLTISSIAPDQ